jgi:hypothetical protein
MYGIIDFKTNLGSVLMIMRVDVKIKDHAIIKCIFSEQDGDDTKHKILMEGDYYKLWGENDDYLGHYCIKKITGGTETIVGTDYVAPTPVATVTASQVYHDDNRSVHNDADLAKITTLEEQMVEQQRMVAQLKSILISKGMI